MRKKPVKYPAEGKSLHHSLPVLFQMLTVAGFLLSIPDFLCELSVREIKAGKITQRPIPSRELPFGDLFETFLMTWSCLNSLG